MQYHTMNGLGCELPSIWETGLRVFSESDEDGVILFLLSVVGTTESRQFVDIGGGNGIHPSNCANLAFNFGFDGLFVDADERLTSQGDAVYRKHPDTRQYPPRFVNAFVTVDTINETIREAGFEGEIDLLSIDIDGNDYWIWKAIKRVRPRVVVIETHPQYGLQDVVAPYVENFMWDRADPEPPFGASPLAMTKLAAELGYRLVGANRIGYNAVYLRDDLGAGRVPTIDVRKLH